MINPHEFYLRLSTPGTEAQYAGKSDILDDSVTYTRTREGQLQDRLSDCLRLNFSHICWSPRRKLATYASAVRGVESLEDNPEKQYLCRD